ncbi:MAG TPA: hypothetical protein VFM63_08215 [Pyrinomonadaceae bacterium]|nr:hypothetical protein [Pyrinomonadaceae bacterium]
MHLANVRIAAVVIVAVFLSVTCPSSALAGGSPEKEARFAQKVKTEIAKLGTGPDARVNLKLRDKTKLKGYISEVGDQSFAVVDDKTGAATTVAYPQVKQVQGNNLNTGVKIAIGIAIVAIVLLILAPHIAQ